MPVSDNEASQFWFVELSSPPAIEGTAVSALEREEASFHAAAAAAGIRYAERRHFRDLFNGLTVRAAARLPGHPGLHARRVPAPASLTPAGFLPQPGGATFTMIGDDVPFILFHLNHQVANLKMEVFDVATGKSLNFADDEESALSLAAWSCGAPRGRYGSGSVCA